MRILHVTDVYLPHLGGIEVFVSDLARRQAAEGHEVTVLAPTPPGSGATPDSMVDVLRAGPSWPNPLRFMPGRMAFSAREFDVVHGHLSVASGFTTLIARSAVDAGVPTVLTVHSLWSDRMAVVRTIGAIAGWRRWPAAWTAVSTIAMQDVRRVLPRRSEVAVVPNAIDVDWWRGGVRRSTEHKDDQTFSIVTVMRLAPRKRPLQFVSALQRLRRIVPADIKLRAEIIGDGPIEQQVHRELARLGLRDWVSTPGRLSRSEIRDRYRDADVFVAPATQESFGIAALEAHTAGVPVVAMRRGGVGEFVTDGEDGVLCADDRELTDALARLATDRAYLARMAKHCQESTPRHGWDRTLGAFEDAYERAASLAGAAIPALPRTTVDGPRIGVSTGNQ